MMGLQLVTPPTVEPVDLERAKLHLRVDGTDEDALIEAMTKAARQNLDGRDGWLGRAICTQTWDLTLDAFPSDAIEIPLPPLRSVESITYVDQDSNKQTVAADTYIVDTGTEPGQVTLAYGQIWPSARAQKNAITVRFVAGYTDGNSPEDSAAAVPETIKLAILLTVGHWYANREAVNIGNIVNEIPMSAKYLLDPLRVWSA